MPWDDIGARVPMRQFNARLRGHQITPNPVDLPAFYSFAARYSAVYEVAPYLRFL